jgi:hypothetical protein
MRRAVGAGGTPNQDSLLLNTLLCLIFFRAYLFDPAQFNSWLRHWMLALMSLQECPFSMSSTRHLRLTQMVAGLRVPLSMAASTRTARCWSMSDLRLHRFHPTGRGSGEVLCVSRYILLCFTVAGHCTPYK